jgi:hypothetical protein
MARLGSTPPAARNAGIAVGPRFVYDFETQTGVPVDGTDARLRNMSPFTFRFVVPRALLSLVESGEAKWDADVQAAIAAADGALAASGNASGQARLAESKARAEAAASFARNPNLIESAARGSNSNTTANEVARALALVSGVGDVSSVSVSKLEAFVAAGQFYAQKDSGFVSTLADAYTAADVALQLSKMLTVEPLTLMVNPTDMTINHTRIHSYQQRGRNGYIYEAWGNELPTISITGSTGGFVAGAPDPRNGLAAQVTRETTTATGYQAACRLDSAAWQNFMALYQMYRNNGYIYDTVGKSEAHLFVGSIAIDYDQMTYVGNIDSLNFSFDAEIPNRVEFDLEFHVSQWYDNARSQATVSPITSGPLNPAPVVSLTTDVGVGRVLSAVDVSTVPFDLLPG